MDPGLAALFGSKDRVRILAALANAAAPLTAYRVATMAGMQPPNVYRELKRLVEVKEVGRAITPEGRDGWVVADPDLRALLRRRLRIAWIKDLSRGAQEREQRATTAIQASAKEPLDLSKFKVGRPLAAAEVRRRREKDAILEKAGARTSARLNRVAR